MWFRTGEIRIDLLNYLTYYSDRCANWKHAQMLRNYLKLFIFYLLNVSVFLAPKILTNESKVAISSVFKFVHTFPCETIGYPRPFIQWIFDGNVRLNVTSPALPGIICWTFIPERSSLKKVQSSYKVYENGSLIFYNPYCGADREYENFTCVATSFLGRDTKSHAFLIRESKWSEKICGHEGITREEGNLSKVYSCNLV